MSLLKQYDSFLLNNASQITGVESTLRSITYFLPGRFKDAELAGEAIYSALNLLGLYHDSILVRALTQQSDSGATANKSGAVTPTVARSSSSSPSSSSPASSSAFTLSEHARYTQHFSHSSRAYSFLARALVIIGYLELLAEMAARRKLSKKRAWDIVAGIEAVKAALRLSLIQLSGNRMTIQPPIPEREVDPATLEQERTKKMASLAASLDKSWEKATAKNAADASASLSATPSTAPKGFWKGARTGFLRPTLASLRPGAKDLEDDAAKSKDAPADAKRTTPPHPRVPGAQAHSGSDSDDTLVANGGPSMASSRTLTAGDAGSKASKATPLEPWTEKQINDYLLSRVVSVNDVRRSEELVRTFKNTLGRSAETLWVLRPLLYVLALRRWGRKHTAPFLLSFCIEYLAKVLRERSLSTSSTSSSLLGSNPLLSALTGGNPMLGLLSSLMGGSTAAEREKRPISTVEETEWSRRDRSFWWYLLRGPAWYGWTRPRLASLVSRTQDRAIIGLVAGIVGDYLPLVDEYYFYSAT